MTPRLNFILLAMLMMLLLPRLGEARPEYAQQQQKKCRECHIRNGNGALNQEGKEFRKNLFIQKGITPPAEQKKQRPESLSEENENRDEKLTAKAERVLKKQKRHEVREEEDDEAEDEEVEESEQPPPKTIVYRWQGKDGSMVFSERPGPPAAGKDDKLSGRVKKNRKPAAPAKIAARPATKRAAAAKPPTAPKSAVTVPKVSTVVKQTFSECMEAELADRPEPSTSDELMNILMEARSKCSHLSTL